MDANARLRPAAQLCCNQYVTKVQGVHQCFQNSEVVEHERERGGMDANARLPAAAKLKAECCNQHQSATQVQGARC